MQNETKDEKGWFLIKYFVMVPLLLLALIIMASCGENKTEEAKSPEVEVEVERNERPEYDVESPNVEIRVDTPDVKVKTPDVDVKAEVDIPSVEVEVRD